MREIGQETSSIKHNGRLIAFIHCEVKKCLCKSECLGILALMHALVLMLVPEIKYIRPQIPIRLAQPIYIYKQDVITP
jgi:hypothetical protein